MSAVVNLNKSLGISAIYAMLFIGKILIFLHPRNLSEETIENKD